MRRSDFLACRRASRRVERILSLIGSGDVSRLPMLAATARELLECVNQATNPYVAHPLRVQRSRSRGARLTAGAVYVGRPTPWGNPWAVGEGVFPLTLDQVRDRYVPWLDQQIADGILDVTLLRGLKLACWCPLDRWCHADELARRANA